MGYRAPQTDRMQRLWPQEVEYSTNHLGATNFMMIHFLGLGLAFLHLQGFMIKSLWPPFVFILSRVSIATTSLLWDIATTVLVVFVLQFVMFHSFNRIWVYCITVFIAIYMCMWIYICSFISFSHKSRLVVLELSSLVVSQCMSPMRLEYRELGLKLVELQENTSRRPKKPHMVGE